MASVHSAYFRLPPVELGATLIFVPQYTKDLTTFELVQWATRHGFGGITYVPAKSKPDTGVEA